ncbi:exodeoxyribonuclease V subunit alpha [Arenimonas caeni]|uniref:RecBCD enzyme subunit RecD n=1 Tax=Arenimonas caeni TaxID=2058085 RepID=A0A2P6M6P7_9GAMM|nr:exodeoxyribonuclease V subunit alpha [Arenimonas caeni]PRH81681.1 exodeoxyribonuclease V subunit alpha [Arenimonas caeni]
MSHVDFRLQPRVDIEGRLPERALGRALARWVLGHGGSEALAALAARAAVAELRGDTALPPLPADEAAALRAEPLVGDGRVRTPFVLDAEGRFYLWRNHLHEGEVAAALAARLADATPLGMDEAELAALFPGGDPATDGAQRQAVRAVGGRRLVVLTGGPGTGKTTTVLRMLLRLLRDGIAARDGIAVAAPTGKAAQRLVQSLREEGERLRDVLPAAWAEHLDALPTAHALTVHRLLGWSPSRNRYSRDAENPVDAGVVVIDEASMLDLHQLRALLAALRPGATLVLVGDADQLDPVGAGSVLMDLVAVLEARESPALVRLRHSFRAVAPLVALNEAVRGGDPDALQAALAGSEGLARSFAVEDAGALARRLRHWSDALAADGPPAPLPAGDEAGAVAATALGGLAARQLLCALRDGPFGAEAANEAIECRLRQAWGVPADLAWYPGRVVMVTRNDYGARLFNGDVGLCLRDADGRLRVWFAAAGGEGVRALPPAALPAHAPAFAITIHKAQGSEYGHVAVLLPPDPEHRILSRQLLYTGLSRAKRSVELWAPASSTLAALVRRMARAGGLAARLAALAIHSPDANRDPHDPA